MRGSIPSTRPTCQTKASTTHWRAHPRSSVGAIDVARGTNQMADRSCAACGMRRRHHAAVQRMPDATYNRRRWSSLARRLHTNYPSESQHPKRGRSHQNRRLPKPTGQDNAPVPKTAAGTSLAATITPYLRPALAGRWRDAAERLDLWQARLTTKTRRARRRGWMALRAKRFDLPASCSSCSSCLRGQSHLLASRSGSNHRREDQAMNLAPKLDCTSALVEELCSCTWLSSVRYSAQPGWPPAISGSVHRLHIASRS